MEKEKAAEQAAELKTEAVAVHPLSKPPDNPAESQTTQVAQAVPPAQTDSTKVEATNPSNSKNQIGI